MSSDEKHPNPLEMLMAAIGHNHDECEMRADAIEVEICAFLDGLTVPQLLTLRRLLNVAKPELLQFFDGQAYSVLRLTHGVDPDTGKSPEDVLLAGSPAPSA